MRTNSDLYEMLDVINANLCALCRTLEKNKKHEEPVVLRNINNLNDYSEVSSYQLEHVEKLTWTVYFVHRSEDNKPKPVASMLMTSEDLEKLRSIISYPEDFVFKSRDTVYIYLD